MERILGTLMAVTIFFHAVESCLIKMEGDSGEIKFPISAKSSKPDFVYTKGENLKTHCIFYKQITPATYLDITFTSVSVGGSTIKVKGTETKDTKFRNFQTLTGNFEPTVPTPLSLINVRYIKIVVPKDAGEFSFKYQIIFCRVPASVHPLACTKDYTKDSHCIFQCAEDHVPVVFQDPKFYAQCSMQTSGHGKWTMDIQNACYLKSHVSDICLQTITANTCPYNKKQLLVIFNEEGAEDTSEPDLNDIKNILDEKDLKIGSKSPSSSSKIVQLNPVQIESLIKNCKYHCVRSLSSRKYFYKCGRFKQNKHRDDCMTCRYSKKNFCRSAVAYI